MPRGRPRKDSGLEVLQGGVPLETTTAVIDPQPEVQPEAPKDSTAGFADLMNKISSQLSSIEQRLVAVEQKAQEIPANLTLVSPSASEPVSLLPKVTDRVKEILGQGDSRKCEFQVSVEPLNEGLDFRLIMIPPSHLREIGDSTDANGKTIINDRRIKVISYLKAVPDSEAYAQKVFQYCVKFANQKGISYFA